MSSVDHFNQLSQKWWDPEGPLKTLHHINTVRTAFVREHAVLQQKSVIDVGCGGGIFTESLAKLGAELSAIDLADDLIAVAKDHASKSNLTIDYQAIALENYLESQNQHDVVVCMELLEHVDDPQAFLMELKKLLKPGGLLFVSTLNRNLKSYLLSIVAAEYLLNLIPKGTHEYKQYIKPSELRTYLNDMECLAMQGIAYNPLTSTCKLTDDLSVNYIAVFKHAG